ncbi:MAG: phosphoethanolamine transferase [Deltaproteobacteria bacterium]|nr:phosphoethanolamine transferase [Deltaproteobacteria bacterium]
MATSLLNSRGSTKQRLHAAAMRVAFLALMVPNIVLAFLEGATSGHLKLLLSFGSVAGLLFALPRRLALLIFLPAFVLLPIDTYYLVEYQQVPTADLVPILLGTNLREAIDFLGPRRVWWVGGSLAAAILLWLIALVTAPSQGLAPSGWLGRARRVARAGVLVFAGLMMMAAMPAFSGINPEAREGDPHHGYRPGLPFQLDRLRGVFPIGRFVSIEEYVVGQRNAAELAELSVNFRFGVAQPEPLPEGEVFVLVIGESARPDRWQLGGYERATNPKLSETPGFSFLRDAIAPWAATAASLPVILTRKPAQHRGWLYAEPGIFRLFKEAGFRTYWISAQARESTGISPRMQIALTADETQWLSGSANDVFGRTVLDTELIPPVEALLRKDEPQQLIVLHSLGSHDAYFRRYPPEFNAWRPSLTDDPSIDSRDPRGREAASNAYDNSILFTDHFLHQLILALERSGRLAVMFYVSDHGESFSKTCSYTGHGHDSRDNFTIAAGIWLSPAFLARNPDASQVVATNAGKRTSSEVTLPTLAHAARLAFSGLDLSRSLLSPSFTEHPRYVQTSTATVLWDDAAFVGPCELVRGRVRSGR